LKTTILKEEINIQRFIIDDSSRVDFILRLNGIID
jgi:hypothetical protein